MLAVMTNDVGPDPAVFVPKTLKSYDVLLESPLTVAAVTLTPVTAPVHEVAPVTRYWTV